MLDFLFHLLLNFKAKMFKQPFKIDDLNICSLTKKQFKTNVYIKTKGYLTKINSR